MELKIVREGLMLIFIITVVTVSISVLINSFVKYLIQSDTFIGKRFRKGKRRTLTQMFIDKKK